MNSAQNRFLNTTIWVPHFQHVQKRDNKKNEGDTAYSIQQSGKGGNVGLEKKLESAESLDERVSLHS